MGFLKSWIVRLTAPYHLHMYTPRSFIHTSIFLYLPSLRHNHSFSLSLPKVAQGLECHTSVTTIFSDQLTAEHFVLRISLRYSIFKEAFLSFSTDKIVNCRSLTLFFLMLVVDVVEQKNLEFCEL